MNPSFEILLKKNNTIVLARVLLQYDILHWKYPKNGVWSYLINTSAGIVVFDTGPYYNTLLGFKGPKTNNTAKILTSIQTLMGNKPITQIILSHYHHDHSQNAADLQQKNKELHKIVAPIRVHKLDSGNKKLIKILNSGLNEIYKNAGFKNVIIDNNLESSEIIEGLENTNFEVLHTPGHTHGSISLVNHKDKILITGWWTNEKQKKLVQLGMYFINEDFKNIENTKLKLDFKDYRKYYLHKIK